QNFWSPMPHTSLGHCCSTTESSRSQIKAHPTPRSSSWYGSQNYLPSLWMSSRKLTVKFEIGRSRQTEFTSRMHVGRDYRFKCSIYQASLWVNCPPMKTTTSAVSVPHQTTTNC